MKRIVAISDQHGFLPPIPECDFLVISGDICPVRGSHHPDDQWKWLDTKFRTWLEEIPAKHVIACAGNHDFVFEHYARDIHPRKLRWNYLQDSGIELDGVKFWGTPWQPWFYAWAFNAPEKNGEDFLAEKFAMVPEDTDVVICHGPPRGFGDKATRDERTGSTALLKRMREVNPRYLFCGHIHEDRGIYEPAGFTCVNASIVNERYELVHNPFELVI